MDERLGGIEFGGTKTVCVVGGRGVVEHEERFPTGSPEQVMDACAAFFAAHEVAAIGLGAFGPCDPDPDSPTHGWITTTPKPGWRDVDLLGGLRARLGDLPMGFDTDVNVAALGELAHGAGVGLSSLVYLTIGTGVGGGGIVDGRLVHGLVHPEMGHMRIPRSDAERTTFPGVCPFHGDCFEGVGAGPALAARWGDPAQDIGADDPRYAAMWDLEADYLAVTLHAIVCVLSPQRIVVGGGVGAQRVLLERVRPRLQASLAGYIVSPAILEGIDTYVVPPALGAQSGGIGALELAGLALTR
ncbi:MAG: ROK family protein [Candidatus Nanopelagicales bacterium]|jgi:fructokinase|nr:ROK family protein [Candidatus Nanopelagicales bacterium]